MSQSANTRSGGGYSLRIQGAKKHLSLDYEYNFSKFETINTTLGNKEVVSSGDDVAEPQSPQPSKLSHGSMQAFVVKRYAVVTDNDFIHTPKRIIYIDKNEELERGAAGIKNSAKNAGDQLQLIVGTGASDLEMKADQEVLKENYATGNMINEHGGVEEEVASSPLVEEEMSSEKILKVSKNSYLDLNGEDVVCGIRLSDRIECMECHKLLKPGSFRQHMRTHSGRKPHSCTVCGAHFTRRGDVDRHVSIVHKKHKPFQCQHCKRSFGDKKNLRWHLANHDKKLFYVCPVCGFKFGKREYFENHVQFLHPTAAEDSEEKILQETDQKDSDVGTVQLEGLKVVALGSGDSSSLLNVPVDQGVTLNDLSTFRLSESADSGKVEAVVIEFDREGTGLVVKCETSDLNLGHSESEADSIPEYIFSAALDGDKSESQWVHHQHSSRKFKEWSGGTLEGSVSQVVELTMNNNEFLKVDDGGNKQYSFEKVEGTQVVHLLGSIDEKENAHFVEGDEDALVVGTDSSSLTQFVLHDGTLIPYSEPFASTMLNKSQNIMLKVYSVQESSEQTGSENSDLTYVKNDNTCSSS